MGINLATFLYIPKPPSFSSKKVKPMRFYTRMFATLSEPLCIKSPAFQPTGTSVYFFISSSKMCSSS